MGDRRCDASPRLSGNAFIPQDDFERGQARVRLVQRRAIENHLGSIHAIALANLAELTGNLALAYAMPDDARFIVTSLAIDYVKKARGSIEAICKCTPPDSSERREYPLEVHISDAHGALVASAHIRTLVSPVT